VRQHIHIGLRPPQANNAPQDSHQPVLNVRQLRARGRTNSINHHQCVHDVPAGGEVVRPYIAGTRIDALVKQSARSPAPSPSSASVTVPS